MMWRITRTFIAKANTICVVRRPVDMVGVVHMYANGPRNRDVYEWDNGDGQPEKRHIAKLVKPLLVKPESDSSAANELIGRIDKTALLRLMETFPQHPRVEELCKMHSLDDYVLGKAFPSFRRYCFETTKLSATLYWKLHDILNEEAEPEELFPFFVQFVYDMFPHLNCIDNLRCIADFTAPESWYAAARSRKRRIIFHGGPTNSGKTYQAMQRFLNAESAIYCGPLKLLVMEVFKKSNDHGTVCDMVTGEEKRHGKSPEEPAKHISITIEMAALEPHYEVAILDEIQMIGDPCRGWAWTRAFLGINADEVHVCGETGALELLQRICLRTGETIEVNTHKRLTSLDIESQALQSLDNLQPGDCIVCFNKNDIYAVAAQIEMAGKEVAVIYGSLPPEAKLAQAAKFNSPDDPCNILVATDAIGMGLNLNIRRMIFYSLHKMQLNADMEKEITLISVSSALQIAGRAGRFGSEYEGGLVTTFNKLDLPTLQYLLGEKPEPLEKAGLHPTAEQIQMFSNHLPETSIGNLMEILSTLCQMNNDCYFMCLTEDMIELSKLIEHIQLPLRTRYVFCSAPVNRRQQFVCTGFVKFAYEHGKGQPISFETIAKHCALPVGIPRTLDDLVQLENIFDVMDIYLWLSQRFSSVFSDSVRVRQAQAHIDHQIQESVNNILRLAREDEPSADQPAKEQDVALERVLSRMVTMASKKEPKKPGAFSPKYSDLLLKRGLASPEMLTKLRTEFAGKRTNGVPALRPMARAAVAPTDKSRSSNKRPTKKGKTDR